jgi:uncharacterized membrane protein YdjX (TVP38/TMEM64 family)
MHWLRKLGPLGPLAILSVSIPPISGLLLLGTINRVGPWLRDAQELGVLLYFVAFTLLGGLALLPTYAQSMLGGWAFGVAIGFPVALGGFVGAALVGYALARRISGDRLEALLAQHTKWNAVYAALLRSGFLKAWLIVTLLRLPPNTPFAASNVAMAALRVPVVPFALGTAAGMAPRTLAVVYAGAGFATLDLANREQTGWFAGGLAATILAVVVIGWMANRALRKVEEASGATPDERSAE